MGQQIYYNVFAKKSKPKWSSGLYTINNITGQSYNLIDKEGKELKHTFRNHMLLPVKEVEVKKVDMEKAKKEKEELTKEQARAKILRRIKRSGLDITDTIKSQIEKELQKQFN